MIIRSLTAEYIQIPLKNPFVLSLRSTHFANIIRWRLETSAGLFNGESVPVKYVTGEDHESVLQIAPEIEGMVVGSDAREAFRLIQLVRAALPTMPAAVGGVEIALLNALAFSLGTSLFRFFGSASAQLETDITLSKSDDAPRIAEEYWKLGFRIFKMKVGGEDLGTDLERILEIRRRLPNACFRLDGNQGFSAQSALQFLQSLDHKGVSVEFLEQPTPKEDLEALAEVAARCVTPIIADESCVSPRDAFTILAHTPIAGVNVKVMKCGMLGALEIIAIAKAAKKKLMIGCMLESEVGMAAVIALAAGTGAFDYVDLDGHILLELPEPLKLFTADGPRISIS